MRRTGFVQHKSTKPHLWIRTLHAKQNPQQIHPRCCSAAIHEMSNMQETWLIQLKNVVNAEADEANGDFRSGLRTVASKIGYNEETLYQIYKGVEKDGKRRMPGVRLANALTRVYGDRESDWQDSPTFKQHLSYKESDGGGGVVIPQYKTGGSMGAGLILRDQPGVIQGWRVSGDWVKQNVRHHSGVGNLCIVTGFGDSMRPMFNPGDPLLVDRGVNTVDYDAIYFFRVEEEGFIKRLQRVPGEGLVALSENKAYKDWTITPNMRFEVFGRVLKVWRGEDF